jgi:hypothetical protein
VDAKPFERDSPNDRNYYEDDIISINLISTNVLALEINGIARILRSGGATFSIALFTPPDAAIAISYHFMFHVVSIPYLWCAWLITRAGINSTLANLTLSSVVLRLG